MNIGEKNYDDPNYQKALSRLDVAILGFYPGWRSSYSYGGYTGIQAAVKAIKDRNPNILLGQYTILNEAPLASNSKYSADADKARKLDNENWWLRKADGSMTRWTSGFDAYDINLTAFTRKDAQGKQWPQWLAERDYNKYFKPVPQFDIWYFDNVFEKNRITDADWNLDRVNDKNGDAKMIAAHRAGHVAEWRRARELRSGIMLMGNMDHDVSMPEYKGKMEGAFLEGAMGKSWSMEKNKGWAAMMTWYHNTMINTAAPKIVGFNVWGKPTDYRFFRYAFASTLMDDGYFSFTDEAKGYSSVPWFDEYDVSLGRPVEGAQTKAWQKGVYRRVYEKGMALVNPTGSSVTVNVGSGYKRIAGNQDRGVNNGQAVSGNITIPAKDGIVLVKG
ncbi:putative glycoside hydrolase [Thermithiobacillus plumbiphilus]|uniref:Glycoside hydrolase n=1 Tax=Thermithiobacillus plumbiphilus TaxID=1729899 RepID=A0ABU9D749_9PROT